MSETFWLDRKIGFRNTFNTKCINVIIDSIGPSIILRSIFVDVSDQMSPRCQISLTPVKLQPNLNTQVFILPCLYICRCIRPNESKMPDQFDTRKVTTQLKYTGVHFTMLIYL